MDLKNPDNTTGKVRNTMANIGIPVAAKRSVAAEGMSPEPMAVPHPVPATEANDAIAEKDPGDILLELLETALSEGPSSEFAGRVPGLTLALFTHEGSGLPMSLAEIAERGLGDTFLGVLEYLRQLLEMSYREAQKLSLLVMRLPEMDRDAIEVCLTSGSERTLELLELAHAVTRCMGAEGKRCAEDIHLVLSEMLPPRHASIVLPAMAAIRDAGREAERTMCTLLGRKPTLDLEIEGRLGTGGWRCKESELADDSPVVTFDIEKVIVDTLPPAIRRSDKHTKAVEAVRTADSISDIALNDALPFDEGYWRAIDPMVIIAISELGLELDIKWHAPGSDLRAILAASLRLEGVGRDCGKQLDYLEGTQTVRVGQHDAIALGSFIKAFGADESGTVRTSMPQLFSRKDEHGELVLHLYPEGHYLAMVDRMIGSALVPGSDAEEINSFWQDARKAREAVIVEGELATSAPAIEMGAEEGAMVEIAGMGDHYEIRLASRPEASR